MEATISELVPAARAASSTHVSFDALYETHFDLVWRTLARVGVPSAHLDDAAQDVFVIAWRRLEGFEHRSTLKTWIVGISLKVASDWRRRRAHSEQALVLDERHPSSERGPEAAAERSQGLELLSKMLGALSDEQREVFVLMEMEQMTAPEVSTVLEVTLNTVYSRLRLGRAAFNQAIAQLRSTR